MKRFLFIIALVWIMSLAACNKKEKFSGVNEDLRYAESYQTVSVTATGVFFRGSDEMIHFRDALTGEDMFLCYDPNCIHEPASRYNTDPTCRAALFPEAKTQIAYYEGNIYYFTSDDLFSHKIYRMEVDGPGRVLIAEIPYYFDIAYGIVFYEDKMYYVVSDYVRVGDMGELDSKDYIMEYDLQTGGYRLVTPEITDMLLGDVMQVTGEYLYLILANGNENGALYVRRYNLETAEEEVFISTEKYQTHRLIRAYDKYYVYYDTNNKVGIRSITDGTDTILINMEKNGILGRVSASGNGILYFVNEVLEDGTQGLAGVFFYNMLTGETVDITEKAAEYNIKKYDAYNGVFICNTLFNTSVVSEEEILGK